MSHLETFNEASKLAHTITQQTLDRARKEEDDAVERNHAFVRKLNEATTNYILTGVGRIPDGPQWCGWVREYAYRSRTYFTWDKYFQKLAKDMKRPYVFMPHVGHLAIARRKYTEPLIGAFMLTAVEKQSHYDRTDAPLTYRKTSDRWYFTFGSSVQVLAEDFLANCKTNPEYRRALKL